jgi:hypothetical protein
MEQNSTLLCINLLAAHYTLTVLANGHLAG